MINDNATKINSDLSKDQTILNMYANEDLSNITEINSSSGYEPSIDAGEILCGKYKIQKKMNEQSGEADLYICTYGKGKYVAKIYRRQVAIKTEVTDALAGVYSPYIAQIFELGEYNGYPVEILPYFQNGSLQGKKFSYEQLKNNIIPALNEGLRVLHENGIIHKDLKPSIVMHMQC